MGEEDDDGSSGDDSTIDVEQEKAEEEMGKVRKKAGVPELAADGLASALAPRIMYPGQHTHADFCEILQWFCFESSFLNKCKY